MEGAGRRMRPRACAHSCVRAEGARPKLGVPQNSFLVGLTNGRRYLVCSLSKPISRRERGDQCQFARRAPHYRLLRVGNRGVQWKTPRPRMGAPCPEAGYRSGQLQRDGVVARRGEATTSACRQVPTSLSWRGRRRHRHDEDRLKGRRRLDEHALTSQRRTSWHPCGTCFTPAAHPAPDPKCLSWATAISTKLSCVEYYCYRQRQRMQPASGTERSGCHARHHGNRGRVRRE